MGSMNRSLAGGNALKSLGLTRSRSRAYQRCCGFSASVAVGTALASGPPHRSVREGLPHTALTSGSCDDQPLVGIWMQYPRGREPVANQPCHVLPTSATKFLTTPSQNAKPDAAHLVAEPAQTRAVSRYRMIVEPPPNHRPQPRAHFGHRAVHVPFELRFDLQ
jgi:hypothetical protein